MITSLEYVKSHLKITHNNLDTVITEDIETAEEMALTAINMEEDEMFERFGKIPARFKNAVSMLVGTMLEHPEAFTQNGMSANPVAYGMIKSLKKTIRYYVQ